ncbi:MULTISPECIES: Txe/YoeB family addiction module toxin [unclassified Caballeronia]|nr:MULTISPECIES: Txe/YoeB family addiction module toxin [unclassified Caballeronia]MCE4543520.1 Txe/YoeB family addiction module toxin [Caballeronia sp. PC1]MCE4567424.1 Txe/YoeB family addiction module toxin [Caballeronia sp. CLC5]BAO87629.1 putative membrane protein [Burkholderia sp. RPE67]
MIVREIRFSPTAWDEYHLVRASNPKAFKKITRLVTECSRSPFTGTGKPQPRTGALWSRWIDEENQLVYEVLDETLVIVHCRGHYGDK